MIFPARWEAQKLYYFSDRSFSTLGNSSSLPFDVPIKRQGLPVLFVCRNVLLYEGKYDPILKKDLAAEMVHLFAVGGELLCGEVYQKQNVDV